MMRVKLLAALPLISFLISAQSQAELLFVGDFESGSLRGIQTQACAPQTLRVVSSPVRSGEHALEANVHGSDPGCWPHHRAEVSPSACHTSPDKEYWYGWSTYLPRDWSNDPGWVLLTQWHAPDHRVMQPLQLQVTGGKLLWVNWIGMGRDAKMNVLFSESLTGDKGRWIDWVVHARWSSGPDGFIQIWKNGRRIVSHSGSTIYRDSSPYWKAGLVYGANNAYRAWFNLG